MFLIEFISSTKDILINFGKANPCWSIDMSGSGTTFKVQMDHPNHQIPMDAIQSRVTRSSLAESDACIIISR